MISPTSNARGSSRTRSRVFQSWTSYPALERLPVRKCSTVEPGCSPQPAQPLSQSHSKSAHLGKKALLFTKLHEAWPFSFTERSSFVPLMASPVRYYILENPGPLWLGRNSPDTGDCPTISIAPWAQSQRGKWKWERQASSRGGNPLSCSLTKEILISRANLS